jgi:hypothetical protein
MAPHYPEVRYWVRGKRWTDNGPGQPPNPSRVQFCKLRGRINGIFDCYNPSEMPCYEAGELWCQSTNAPLSGRATAQAKTEYFDGPPLIELGDCGIDLDDCPFAAPDCEGCEVGEREVT